MASQAETFKQSNFDILVILRDNHIIKKSDAVTIAYLVDTLQYSRVTIQNELSKMMSDGLIEYGLKQGKSFTYFITDEGLKKIKEFE